MKLNGDKLTDFEVVAISGQYNFAEGHAKYPFRFPPPDFGAMLQQTDFSRLSQQTVEYEFGEAFFTLAGQTICHQNTMYCPAASLSIEIVANYLRLYKLSAALIEPTFDNLADILKRHNVPLETIKEEGIRSYGIDAIKSVSADALFLVLPNNPTGFNLTKHDFEELASYCARTTKLLILDLTFRWFDTTMALWDQYKTLDSSGTKYIAIEDTGKAWPTFELKVSPLVADPITYSNLLPIYRDMFICTSPFTLMYVTEFIKTSLSRGTESTLLYIPRANRTLLRAAIADYPLIPMSTPDLSVEWIRLENNINDSQFVGRMSELGVHVLPGRHFFWGSSLENSKYVRFALMRGIDKFEQGIEHLKYILPKIMALA